MEEGRGQVDVRRFQWKGTAQEGGVHLGCGDNVQVGGRYPLYPSLGPEPGGAGQVGLCSEGGAGEALRPLLHTHAPCSGPCPGGWGTLCLHLDERRWWGVHLGCNPSPPGVGTLSDSGVRVGDPLQMMGPERAALAVSAAAAGVTAQWEVGILGPGGSDLVNGGALGHGHEQDGWGCYSGVRPAGLGSVQLARLPGC